MLHDTHVHLDFLLEKLGMVPEFDRNNPTERLEFDHDKLDQLLQNHEFVIQATISGRNFALAHKLFSWCEKVHFLYGYHPEEVNATSNATEILIEQKLLLAETLQNKSLVGIGEIGLDYYWSDDTLVRKLQSEIFEAHLAWAVEYGLGVCVHIRDKRGENSAMEDGIAILKNHPGIRFVVHCFTGNQTQADQILAIGGHLGFGGIITYNSGKDILEIATNTPTDRILLETDLPFLAPTSYRGQVCLPEYIAEVGKILYQEKGIGEEVLWEIAKVNSQKLFLITNPS